jgi:hypothetical protein
MGHASASSKQRRNGLPKRSKHRWYADALGLFLDHALFRGRRIAETDFLLFFFTSGFSPAAALALRVRADQMLLLSKKPWRPRLPAPKCGSILKYSEPRQSSASPKLSSSTFLLSRSMSPPPRKPWKSEEARIGIFDAAALACMYLTIHEKTI